MHWRQKPAGWPEYMVSKTLARAEVGYYWQPPTWARARGCLLRSKPLEQTSFRPRLGATRYLTHFSRLGAGTILLPPPVRSSELLIGWCSNTRFRQSGKSLPMARAMITTVSCAG